VRYMGLRAIWALQGSAGKLDQGCWTQGYATALQHALVRSQQQSS
jgi:hypothetical protein